MNSNQPFAVAVIFSHPIAQQVSYEETNTSRKKYAISVRETQHERRNRRRFTDARLKRASKRATRSITDKG